MTLEYRFETLNDALIAQGAICSIAELQGMICGQLAGGRHNVDDHWVQESRKYLDLIHFDTNEAQRELILFTLKTSREALLQDDFSFKPLLPDDACPLADRSREVGAWCRGFLYGFGASGVTKDTQLSAEVAELIRDLARISQGLSHIGEEDDPFDETSERDWNELVEYLRTAVFTVYADMNTENLEGHKSDGQLH